MSTLFDHLSVSRDNIPFLIFVFAAAAFALAAFARSQRMPVGMLLGCAFMISTFIGLWWRTP